MVPSAGPPCFLDPELRDLNDDHGDPANIFPDQMVFLDQMRRNGHDRGLLMMPGSTAEFSGAQLDSHQHPLSTEQVEAIFTTGKADYIERYAQRKRAVLQDLLDCGEVPLSAGDIGERSLEPGGEGRRSHDGRLHTVSVVCLNRRLS